MLCRALAILACLSAAALANSPSDTVTIPLKDIWALDMPGTKDVRELEPDIYGDGMRNISDIERDRRINKSLVTHVGRGAVDKVNGPEAGFAVIGNGHDALKHAYSYFHDNKPPQTAFPTNDDISLIFFSYTFGPYVYLDHIERKGNTFEIYFRFVNHMTDEVTEHYAIIPVGKLPVGEYEVKIIQLPVDARLLGTKPDFRPVDLDAQRRVICKPFSFAVKSQ
jgi:hypothetical protein